MPGNCRLHEELLSTAPEKGETEKRGKSRSPSGPRRARRAWGQELCGAPWPTCKVTALQSQPHCPETEGASRHDRPGLPAGAPGELRPAFPDDPARKACSEATWTRGHFLYSKSLCREGRGAAAPSGDLGNPPAFEVLVSTIAYLPPPAPSQGAWGSILRLWPACKVEAVCSWTHCPKPILAPN